MLLNTIITYRSWLKYKLKALIETLENQAFYCDDDVTILLFFWKGTIIFYSPIFIKIHWYKKILI